MSFFGDLSSISLTNLLQNLESNGQTGTLSFGGTRQKAWVFLHQGKVAMFAREGRPELMESLVACGVLTAHQLETVRSRRRGSRRSLVETAIELRYSDAATIRQAAHAILVDDLCDLIMTAEGEFRFTEGGAPARIFDPEERALGISIAASPLLLEAASRSDHWKIARAAIPADSVRFLSPREPMIPAEVEDQELAVQILEQLDGTRDVAEVLARFPGRRLQAFQVLAALVRSHAVQAVEADGLLAIAAMIGGKDPRRARQMLAQALKSQPNHLGLLSLEAQLAAQMNDRAGAANSYKLIAHLKFQSGEAAEGKRLLQKARELAPGDTSIWERLLDLEIDQGNADIAVATGMQLVKLHRAPGLHGKACEVLERLVDLVPTSTDLRTELAQSQVDAGNPQAAVRSLSRQGKLLIGRGEYKDARRLLGVVLEIDPQNGEAKRCIVSLDSKAYQRRKERMRRVARRIAALLVMALLGSVLGLDLRARWELAEASTGILRDRLIEGRRYGEAIARYREVEERHPYTPTSLWEIRQRIRVLEQSLEQERRGK